MFRIDWKKLRAYGLVIALAIAGTVALMPARPVVAQARALPDFTDLVEQVGPSVVNIRTLERSRAAAVPRRAAWTRRCRSSSAASSASPCPARRARRRGPTGRSPDEEQPRGVGSGFILSTDGFVMTNAHVVDGADEVLVTLPDKREFKAKIVGSDKRTDVAVVKIDATGLPAVKVGDVTRLKVGEWVMAIGSPFGLENTVTAGIVSAKQRDTGDYLPFIQTDVAINPGNSGGPLINMRGEVVGINSQIYSRSGGFMGISFAIPIDEAIRVSEQLRAVRPGLARPHRRADRPGDQGRGRVHRPGQAAGRAGAQRRKRLAGRQGRRRGGRHHHPVRRQGDRQGVRPAAPGGQHQARHTQQHDGVPARRLEGPEHHDRRNRTRKDGAAHRREGRQAQGLRRQRNRSACPSAT